MSQPWKTGFRQKPRLGHRGKISREKNHVTIQNPTLQRKLENWRITRIKSLGSMKAGSIMIHVSPENAIMDFSWLIEVALRTRVLPELVKILVQRVEGTSVPRKGTTFPTGIRRPGLTWPFWRLSLKTVIFTNQNPPIAKANLNASNSIHRLKTSENMPARPVRTSTVQSSEGHGPNSTISSKSLQLQTRQTADNGPNQIKKRLKMKLFGLFLIWTGKRDTPGLRKSASFSLQP